MRTKMHVAEDPQKERGVFHVGPDGRVVAAGRFAVLKPGWRVATEADLAPKPAPADVPVPAVKSKGG